MNTPDDNLETRLTAMGRTAPDPPPIDVARDVMRTLSQAPAPARDPWPAVFALAAMAAAVIVGVVTYQSVLDLQHPLGDLYNATNVVMR